MRFRKASHSIYHTEYHIVLTPRYRRKLFIKGVKEYLEKMLLHLDNLDPDIEVIKVNVRDDHVHMVIIIPPRIAVADVVCFIKNQSAKKIRAKFPYLAKVYRGQAGIWSRGYCISSIGLNEKEILRYVGYQEKEDRGQLQIKL